MSNIASFAFIGIKNFVFRDKTSKEVLCNLEHMVNISLTDETAQDFLRGGYGNPKLLTIYGDRDCKLEGTTATMTTDLMKIMSNNSVVTKTTPEQFVETLTLSGGVFTLTNTPSIGITPTIFKVDADGKIVKPALVVGTPATNATDYSIASTAITCHSSVTKIKVFYDSDVTVETIEAKDNTPKNYEVKGLLVCKEIETGNLYTAWIDCPNATVQPSFTLQGKNDSAAPDAVTVNIDLLVGADGYPYKLAFIEEA